MEWNGKIIIFDFEVFKYDCLLGTIIIENNSQKYYQTWNIEEMKKFFYLNENSLWVGWNNRGYDNHILEVILKDKNPYNKSVEIIKLGDRKLWSNLKFLRRDVVPYGSFWNLKISELVYGKNISESEVDFDLDRFLTDEEKQLTENYNKDDLNQTLNNFFEKTNFGTFKTRINIIKEFKLDWYEGLESTEAQVAAKCLGAKRINGIEYQTIEPPSYPFLKLNNQEFYNFYKQGLFKEGKKFNLNICGLDHKLGDGGGHGALKNCHFDKVIYCDVSGYYNLLMINLDLLPRSMPEESKQRYINMYFEQLKLKKTDPDRRNSYKVILLAVWGAMRQERSDFYDPEKGMLMTITGQLFIIDLLEKLEPYITLVQTNTDGIMIVPKDWENEQLVLDIVKEWTDRTKFTIKPTYIYDLYQRDVNNYMYRDDEGKIHCKGEALKHWNSLDNIFGNKAFDSKEPIIIAKGIVNYFMFKKLPIETIYENLEDLRNFERSCKKGSAYEYLCYEITNIEKNEIISSNKVQKVNRLFAWNNLENEGMMYKCKYLNGRLKKDKVSNLASSVIVFNEEINSEKNKNEILKILDIKYYEKRIYERIGEFIGIPLIKDINL